MKKILFLCALILISLPASLYAERFYFELGLTPGISYSHYFEDIDGANKGNIPYRNISDLDSLNFHAAFFSHFPEDSKFLFGIGLYYMDDVLHTKNISGSINEKSDVTSINILTTVFSLRYYLNTVCFGPFFQGGIGIATVDIFKDDDIYHEGRGGFLCKTGTGYAFEINPGESAIHIGIDILYTRDRWSGDGQKENWSLLNTQVYVSFLW